jgi:hypothetical protein
MNLKHNTNYSSDVFKLLTKDTKFYSDGKNRNKFVEFNNIGSYDTSVSYFNNTLYEVKIPENSIIRVEQHYTRIIYTSNIELVLEKQVCITDLLNTLHNVKDILQHCPCLIKYLDKFHPMYNKLCTNIILNEEYSEYIMYVKNIILQQKLAMSSYSIFIQLPQENLTDQMLIDFINSNKLGGSKITEIFLNLKKFINPNVFLHILYFLKKESIEYLLINNPHLSVNFEKDKFYEMLIKYYVKLFTNASKQEKLNYKFIKVIHTLLINDVIPATCLPDIMQISKKYLLYIDIPFDVQQIILSTNPNYLKHIQNQQDDLIIFSVKRCFKLILYVKNINNTIFNELLKFHGLEKIKKLYNKCKEFKPDCGKGVFRCFDLIGFLERCKTLFPDKIQTLTQDIDLSNIHDTCDKLKLNPKMFKTLVDPSEELCIQAIELDKKNIKYIKNITLNIYNKIVELDAINIFNSDVNIDTYSNLSRLKQH